MPPKQPTSSQADALGTVQRLSAVFSAANSAGDDNDGPRALCAAAAALKPSERAELGSVRDQKGRTLLHHAAAGGSAEAVRRVLDADYDPESKGDDGAGSGGAKTTATTENDTSRPPLDARDNSGDTALSLAAGAGALDAVDLLLKRGACPQGGGSGDTTTTTTNATDAPLTPLHRAAAAPGDSGVACVRRLLEAGADVDAPSGAAGTPLGMAALARNTPAARALLAAGAKPDAATLSGVTPLTSAAANVDEELAGRLLDAGADPKRAANGGMTPLHALAAAGLRRRARRRQEQAEEVGGGAASANAANAAAADEDKAHGCSAARLARRLLEKGADPDATDGGGALPIVVAAACGPAYRPLVDALLPATKARPAGFENAAVGSGDKDNNTSWTADNVARYAEAQLRLQEREHEAARAAAEARVASSLQADRAGSGGGAGGGDDDFDAATRPFPPPRDPEILPASESQAADIKAQGDAAFVRQDMKAAEGFYTDALKRWTQSAPLWSNRAAARLALGDAKGALDDARKARTLQRDYVKAWYREGKAASALGLWRAAAGALAEASRLDPASDEVGEALEKAVSKARRQAAQQQQQQAK